MATDRISNSHARAPDGNDAVRGKDGWKQSSREWSPHAPVPSSSSKGNPNSRRNLGKLKKSPTREDRHEGGSKRSGKSKSKKKSGDPSEMKKEKIRTLSLTRGGYDTDGSGKKSFKSRRKEQKKSSIHNPGDDTREKSLKVSGSDAGNFETSVPRATSLPRQTYQPGHIAIRTTGEVVASFTAASPAASEVGIVKKAAFQFESSQPVRKVRSSKSGDELERMKKRAAATTAKRRSSLQSRFSTKPSTTMSTESHIDKSEAINTKQRRSASAGKYFPRATRRSPKSKSSAGNNKNSDEVDHLSGDSNKVQDAVNLFGGKVKRSLSPKQKSLDVGKLRQAYVKQDASKNAKEFSSSLVAPSFDEEGGKRPVISRTSSGGNRMRNVYLRQVTSGGDGTVSSSTASAAPIVGGVGRSSSSNLSTSNETKDTTQNASRNLAKSLGSHGTNKTKASPVAIEPSAGTTSTTTGKGGAQLAYLNAARTRTRSPLSSGRAEPRVPVSSESTAGRSKLKTNPYLSGDKKDDSMELNGSPKRNDKDISANEEKNKRGKNFILLKDSAKTQEVMRPKRRGRTKESSSAAVRRSSSLGALDKRRVKPAMEGSSSSIASRADAFSTIFSHNTKGKSTLEEPPSTPKGIRRKLNISALNLASPGKNKQRTAPKRKDMKKLFSQESANSSFADTVVSLFRDRSKKSQVRELCDRIQKADGIPTARRLSMRDNDLIVSMIGAIRNDPDVKSIIVDGDVSFNTVSTTLLFQFLEALGMNMHLRRLTFKNVQLGNDILYALATAMEKNFMLEEIDLSWNLFTSEGLSNFCQALANTNQTCKRVILNNQTTPISVASEVDVLEAFGGNKRIMYAKVDFNSEDGIEKLNKILRHNKLNPPGPFDRDKRIFDLLSFEAERAEAIMEQRKAENQPLEVPEDDWEYFYELGVLFDKYKLKDIVETENNDTKKSKPKNADSLGKDEKSNFLFGQFKNILDDSIGCFNSDGSFLTAEFISKYLKKTQDTEELVFDFHGQWKLFKRFPVTDPARKLIVTKFVDAIVSHPKMKEFMGINMANTGCGDDFLEELAERCLTNPNLLPNLHVINFETNFINERGCVALSKLISNPKCLRYLQRIRLENQKGLLTSKAEFSICRAMFVNRSVVVVSLQFRGLMERQQIHSYVSRNVDFLRQARQRHYKKTGTGRKRNEMEVYFDKIASNHQSIKGEVKLSGDRKFLSLNAEERIKAAESFATNRNITSINLNGCEIDDAFAEALGQSLLTNTTIEKVSLENNCISATGIQYLFKGIAKNPKLKELRLHKQSKNIPAAEEDALVDILESNETLTKLGIDLRSQNTQVKVDRKLKMNDRLKRSPDSSENLNYLLT